MSKVQKTGSIANSENLTYFKAPNTPSFDRNLQIFQKKIQKLPCCIDISSFSSQNLNWKAKERKFLGAMERNLDSFRTDFKNAKITIIGKKFLKESPNLSLCVVWAWARCLVVELICFWGKIERKAIHAGSELWSFSFTEQLDLINSS